MTLCNQTDANGAMYHPSVAFTKKGNIIVRRGVVDDFAEEVGLAADLAGNLTVLKQVQRKF